MRERSYKVLIAVLVSVAWISPQARVDTNVERTKIDFQGGSSLFFSQPIKNVEAKKFGLGWKRAVFVEASGSQIPIFQMEVSSSMGGLIFFGNYSPRISPSGKYAVLDVLRAGVVDPGFSGAAEDSTRQYCPVLSTVSGCLVSMQTGELCGGDWSEKADEWIVTGYEYDATKAMVAYGFSGSNDLWDQFLKSTKLNRAAKIKQYLVDNLGVTNVMACDPPTASNRAAYTLIARQLIKEGDRIDAAHIEEKLDSSVDDASWHRDMTINVDKTYLYDMPDYKAKTKMCLVKGDAVKVLDKSGEDWARIEYVGKNGTNLDKWIQTASIK